MELKTERKRNICVYSWQRRQVVVNSDKMLPPAGFPPRH